MGKGLLHTERISPHRSLLIRSERLELDLTELVPNAIDKTPAPMVGINGFGRIGEISPHTSDPHVLNLTLGRALFQLGLERTDVNIVAVNHTALSLEHLLTAIRHDSTHGPCPHALDIAVAPPDYSSLLPATSSNPSPSGLLYRGKTIHLFSQRDATKLDWQSAGVEYVLESTGKMTTREKASVHIKCGKAKKV